MSNEILHEKVVMRVLGDNEHAVAIMNRFKRRGREQNIDSNGIDEVLEKCKRSTYEELKELIIANAMFV